MGEDIAVGPYVLAVQGVRPAPDPAPPLNIFRDEPGRKAVIVSVSWRALPTDLDVGSRRMVIEGFLRHQASIADSAGRTVRPDSVSPEALVRGEYDRLDWRDWAVVFYVPEDSRDLVFVVENPEPRQGQARLTAVRLER